MRTFALVLGIVFLAIGVLGFFPGLVTAPAPGHELAVDGMHGQLFGLFPVNWLHNLIHALFGVWGIVAARGWGASRAYARSVAIIYGVLTVMGLIPVLNTTFGLVPIYGNDVWLHAILAVAAAYFGWAVKAPVEHRAGTTARI